jgi:hypothetical protein
MGKITTIGARITDFSLRKPKLKVTLNYKNLLMTSENKLTNPDFQFTVM